MFIENIKNNKMIFGIGVDLMSVKRMSDVVERWGEKFTSRIFTDREADYCFSRSKSKSVSSLAMRFAAKEAFSKALGLGISKGIEWRDIEVINDHHGRPELNITGKALMFCRKSGIEKWHVSLSDERDFCIAFVVLEKGGSVASVNNPDIFEVESSS